MSSNSEGMGLRAIKARDAFRSAKVDAELYSWLDVAVCLSSFESDRIKPSFFLHAGMLPPSRLSLLEGGCGPAVSCCALRAETAARRRLPEVFVKGGGHD